MYLLVLKTGNNWFNFFYSLRTNNVYDNRNLGSNSLSGSIPSEIGQLTQLTGL